VAHLGFSILGTFALNREAVTGAVAQMINHGISTGALFLLIGMMYERRHSRDIAAFGGIARSVPILSLLLTLVAFSSIGLPGLNGFIGEFLVLLGSFGRYPWAAGIAATVVIFAAAYLLWAIQRIVFNKLDKPENASLKDLSVRELVVLAPLIIGIIWMGLYPAPLLRRTEASARQFIEYAQPGRSSAINPAGVEVQP
jgi:NADH-quinone oxidoreductase subunit M